MNAETASPACRQSMATQIFRDAIADSELMQELIADVPELADFIDARARRLDEKAPKKAYRRKATA